MINSAYRQHRIDIHSEAMPVHAAQTQGRSNAHNSTQTLRTLPLLLPGPLCSIPASTGSGTHSLSLADLRSGAVLALFVVTSAVSTAASRVITIDNQCSGPIYPAYQGPTEGVTALDGSAQAAGWVQAAAGTYQFNVPDTWSAARIWARTGCTTSSDSSYLDCIIGGCDTAMACSGSERGGQGATLAEFTLIDGGMDSFDVSIVDGYNLPMTVTPMGGTGGGGCMNASCGAETDLLTMCDPSLVYPFASDKIWSCASPCLANVWFASYGSDETINPSNSPSCCNGAWAERGTCTSDLIPFYSVYKAVCRNAYVYADDDNYADAVLTCSGNPNYTITFCPNGVGASLDPPSTAVSQSPGGPISSSPTGGLPGSRTAAAINKVESTSMTTTAAAATRDNALAGLETTAAAATADTKSHSSLSSASTTSLAFVAGTPTSSSPATSTLTRPDDDVDDGHCSKKKTEKKAKGQSRSRGRGGGDDTHDAGGLENKR